LKELKDHRMAPSAAQIPLSSPQEVRDSSDLTGRSQMVRNVLGSWVCQMAFVLVGFVLPRIVDRRIGQESLGVWDLGWSVLSYFGLASLGIIGSITRRIAQARAARDSEMLCVTASTGMLIYLCTGTVVVMLALGTTYLTPVLFGERLGDKTTDAQWVICLLGISVAVQFYSAVFTAVLTGCHRWIWHNGIASGVYLGTASGMISAVLLGGGLRTMAGLTLGGEVTAGFLRLLVAYRCCPGLRVSLRYVRWSTARDMLGYGGKSMLYVVASVLMRETTRVMVLGYLGSAALAIYSRPLSLVRQAGAFGAKFANVFAPTASAYEAAGNADGLRELMIAGGRYALYLFLPIVVVLSISGRYVLRLWMGDRYDSGSVLAILALGNLPLFFQLATMEIIRGMNRHGLPSVAFLFFAAFGVPIAVIMLGRLDWGIAGGAVAAVAPLALLYGLFLPIYACRLIGLPVLQYLAKAVPGPVLANVPLALPLLVCRVLWPNRMAANLLGGVGVGVLLLGLVYWTCVLPEDKRVMIARVLGTAWDRLFGRRVYSEYL
jgi:O-antigen/teichoic acid export membrane protein